MRIQISPLSQIPIYEQIKEQIRERVLLGEIISGTQLPSIRLLARELKVGIITIKRAYDDLCVEGILISKQGVGVFVAEIDKERTKQIQLSILHEQLVEIVQNAQISSISIDEIIKIIREIGEKEGHYE